MTDAATPNPRTQKEQKMNAHLRDDAATEAEGAGVVGLTPTQQLMMELLVARYRLGERTWTLETNPTVMKAVKVLEARDLAWWKHGVVEHSILAGLTDAGRRACVSPTYVPPVFADSIVIPHSMLPEIVKDDEGYDTVDVRDMESIAFIGKLRSIRQRSEFANRDPENEYVKALAHLAFAEYYASGGDNNANWR